MKRYLAATFAALRFRNYRLFFLGQSVSVAGTWMQRMAQGWLVLELTDSSVWLGVTLAAQQLPTLMLTAWGGVLADRFSKRNILICTAVAAMIPALLLGLLTLTGHVNVQIVLALVLAEGDLGGAVCVALHRLRVFVFNLVQRRKCIHMIGSRG